MEKQKWIYGILLFVTMTWGMNVVMVKFLTGSIPPMQLSAYRIVAATLMLIPLVAWKVGIKALMIKKQALLPILMVGCLTVFAHNESLV